MTPREEPVDRRLDLDEDLAELFESGVLAKVGTRDARLRPACTWAMGARVDRERGLVTLFIPEERARKTLENLRDNGLVAVTFSRPIDHRAIQLKGRCLSTGPTNEAERAFQERYRAAFGEHLQCVGWPRALVRRLVYWPSVAVVVQPGELFEQTPGPKAGTPLVVAP